MLQTLLRHPECPTARQNRDCVFTQMRKALDVIHYVSTDGGHVSGDVSPSTTVNGDSGISLSQHQPTAFKAMKEFEVSVLSICILVYILLLLLTTSSAGPSLWLVRGPGMVFWSEGLEWSSGPRVWNGLSVRGSEMVFWSDGLEWSEGLEGMVFGSKGLEWSSGPQAWNGLPVRGPGRNGLWVLGLGMVFWLRYISHQWATLHCSSPALRLPCLTEVGLGALLSRLPSR